MDNQNNRDNNSNNNRQGWGIILFTTLLVTFVVMALYSMMQGSSPEEITYDRFLELVEDGDVQSVELGSNRILITLTDEARQELMGSSLPSGNSSIMNRFQSQQSSGNTDSDSDRQPDYYTGYVSDDTLAQRLDDAGVEFKGTVPDTAGSIFFELMVTLVLPVVLFGLLFMFVMRKMSKGGGMMGIGKSNAKVYMEKETGVTFQDVAGQDEAKESLQEVVDFLHNPGKYTGIGAKLPKGALLVGPPGTGKTLLAKAVAGEAKVPFFSLSGSAFVEMYVGVGASRVRDLFKQAQQMAPCIVFIDEIDAIGKTRDTMMGGNDEREQTLNQLLAEMDGFDTNKGLLILAATNRPEVLDPALLRPGRFDRRIIVDKPDLKGRIDVLKVHAKDVKMDESVDLEAIALATSGAVGSDLANMINEAAINAVKNGRHVVSQKDLFEAVEVVLV
ncbi:MAG TPA: ATP-dependent metallopeptidase FtsH/Yme1/Tma family protein, partial [Candidatus Mediterraneibacter cottocaccae]|nr:ATP-dependent metallopeptidase FtsH/Yme1/Tma family protein [Candidatus Mediterraneibacter cottocaccae]